MTTKIKEFKGSLSPIFNESLGDVEIAQKNFTEEQIAKDYLHIKLIRPRDDQPRKIFNELKLEELTQSIKSKGILQPIIVRPTDGGLYEIIVGERRWRAAKRAGLEKIPVIIRDYSKPERMAVALIENIQRENLNPLEEAEALQSLIKNYEMTHSQIAESIGRSRATVTNLIRLLDLAQEVKSMINSGLFEMGHARALLGLSHNQQIQTAKTIVNRSLSVRQTEKFIQDIKSEQVKPTFFIDPKFEEKAEAWKANLSRQLSSKVNMHITPEGKGKIVIYFDSVEEANWLMDHLKTEE